LPNNLTIQHDVLALAEVVPIGASHADVVAVDIIAKYI